MSADPLIIDTLSDVLASLAPVDGVRDAERTGRMSAPLWSTLADGEFLLLGLPEEVGGGGGLQDAAALLRLAGYYGAPLPLAENGLLGRRLLAEAGLPVGTDVLALAPRAGTLTVDRGPAGGYVVSGTAERVPWGREAQRIVALVPAHGELAVVAAPLDGAGIEPGRNLAGEPRDRITLDRCALGDADVASAPAGMTVERFLARGAAARALLMAGALDRVRDLCVEHCGSRKQFGRPLNRFQAVAQHLAVITEQAMLTRMAVELAASELAVADASYDAMIAKAIAGSAVSEVARRAHQVHGAIGVTEEYALQLFTRRLWAWRDEFGSERYWSHRIGGAAVAAGADLAWDACVNGLRSVAV
jgi:acyl-CoA dehydrogenase